MQDSPAVPFSPPQSQGPEMPPGRASLATPPAATALDTCRLRPRRSPSTHPEAAVPAPGCTVSQRPAAPWQHPLRGWLGAIYSDSKSPGIVTGGNLTVARRYEILARFKKASWNNIQNIHCKWHNFFHMKIIHVSMYLGVWQLSDCFID